MNCVHTDCDTEAERGGYYCMSHEKKPQLVLRPAYAAILLEMAVKILKEWSATPPISQRTLITAVRQLPWAQFGLSREPEYDEIALVLRKAVDTGDLVSYEKNDATFYELPEMDPAPTAPTNMEQAVGRVIRSVDVAPAPVITHQFLVSLGISGRAQDELYNMLNTGLYGASIDQLVREAVCAYVREYVKGKR